MGGTRITQRTTPLTTAGGRGAGWRCPTPWEGGVTIASPLFFRPSKNLGIVVRLVNEVITDIRSCGPGGHNYFYDEIERIYQMKGNGRQGTVDSTPLHPFAKQRPEATQRSHAKAEISSNQMRVATVADRGCGSCLSAARRWSLSQASHDVSSAAST